MFGTYRTFLALLVVLQHLLGVPNVGGYAVSGFFVLSGYLMTFVVCETYGHSRRGMARFAINRALRLYPTNLVTIGLTVCLIWVLGESYTSNYAPAMTMPTDTMGWLTNFSMIYPSFRPVEVLPRLSPPTWALTIELVFYALIGLGLSKSKTLTIYWFVFSCILTVTLIIISGAHIEMTGRLIYFSIASGSLPFSLGALLYHFRHRFSAKEPSAISVLTITAYLSVFFILSVLLPVLAKLIGTPAFPLAAFYLNILLQVGFIAYLIGRKPNAKWKRLDDSIGEYSYPVYLLHFGCGALVCYLIYGEVVALRSPEALIVMLASLPILFAISYLVLKLVDAPVAAVRKRIRNMPANTPTT